MPRPDQAAVSILRHLQEMPSACSVDKISEATGLAEDQVVSILDSHLVAEDGTISKVEPGRGGGWLPEEVAVEYRTAAAQPEQLGFRWPDDTLHDVQFDINDESHRQQVGITETDYARMRQAAG